MSSPLKSEETAPAVNRQHQLALAVTYINIVLYALCYQFQRPVEPFLLQQLVESSNSSSNVDITATYGRLQSFFSLIQTVGSPAVGWMLDKIGVRYASAVVFGASAASYAILAYATNLNWLFYSKIPTAFQHAFLVAQATAAVSTAGNELQRAQALARMTTAYTIGATLGPALGGYLAQQGDLYVGARWAVAGSCLSVVLSLLALPSVVAPSKEGPEKSDEEGASNNNKTKSQDIVAMLRRLWPLLVVKVVGGFAASMHSTALPLVLTQTLQWDAAAMGWNMSAGMFSVALLGAFGMAPLMKLLGAPGMAHTGLFSRSVLGLLVAIWVVVQHQAPVDALRTPSSPWPITLTCMAHGLVSHMLATGLTTQTTGLVRSDEQGTLLGIEHGLFSLARIYGPTAATTLLMIGVSSSSKEPPAHGMLRVEAVCGVVDVVLLLLLLVMVPVRKKEESKKSS